MRAARSHVLDTAYAAHPELFVNRPPVPPLPRPAGINRKPDDQAEPAADSVPERSEIIPRSRSERRTNAG